MKKAKWNYNFEDDIFVARPLKRKYDSSLQIGSFVFDLDKKGKINGFEIINASKLFKIPKIFLKNIISSKMKISVSAKYIKIEINVKSLIRNAHKSSTLNFERIKPELISPTELNLAAVSS